MTEHETTDINVLIERDLKYLRAQNAKLARQIEWIVIALIVMGILIMLSFMI